MLRVGHEGASGVGLEVVHEGVEGVGHTAPIVDPHLHTVALGVELQDELIVGDAANPDRIHLGVLGHKGEICSPDTDPFLIDYQLLGRFLRDRGVH